MATIRPFISEIPSDNGKRLAACPFCGAIIGYLVDEFKNAMIYEDGHCPHVALYGSTVKFEEERS